MSWQWTCIVCVAIIALVVAAWLGSRERLLERQNEIVERMNAHELEKARLDIEYEKVRPRKTFLGEVRDREVSE